VRKRNGIIALCLLLAGCRPRMVAEPATPASPPTPPPVPILFPRPAWTKKQELALLKMILEKRRPGAARLELLRDWKQNFVGTECYDEFELLVAQEKNNSRPDKNKEAYGRYWKAVKELMDSDFPPEEVKKRILELKPEDFGVTKEPGVTGDI